MVIDIVCLAFAAYGFWIGYSKGIIATVLSLSSYLFGVLIAMRFGPMTGEIIHTAIPQAGSSVSFLGGVLITFILTLVMFRLVARMLTSALQSVNINFINQVLGGVLASLFFVFIFSGLVYFGRQTRIVSDEAIVTSITYPVLEEMPDVVIENGKSLYPVFRDFYNQAIDAMDRLRESVDKEERDSIFELDE